MKTIKIFLLIILSLSITACSNFFEKSKEIRDWEDEVLIADDCGSDGLACCDNDGELSCHFEQTCCINPDNKNQHYCANDCNCGKLNAFCCDGNSCNEGLSCQDGMCRECGELDQTCCENNKQNQCKDNLLCYQKKCIKCGELNVPCCENSLCNENDKAEARIECQNDFCVYCGSNSYKKCLVEPFCDEKNFIQDNICLGCGGFNQACCPEGGKICEDEFSCVNGFCLEDN